MTKYGWDASDYDWGRGPMNLDAARKDGISLFSHKVSEGKTGWFRAVHAAEAYRRAVAAGFPVLGGYHVLHPAEMGAIDDQLDWFFTCLNDAFPDWKKHPCFTFHIDAEKFAYMTRRPNLSEINQFGHAVVKRTGCAPSQVVVYGPEWLYGDNLAGVDFALWASGYGSNPKTGYKNAYPGDHSSGWDPYSGVIPVGLQYGSQTTIGTQPICDASAIRVASEADLVALFLGEDVSITDDEFKRVSDIVQTQVRQELVNVFRATFTGVDSGPYTHADYPNWVANPGLRELAVQTANKLDNVKDTVNSVKDTVNITSSAVRGVATTTNAIAAQVASLAAATGIDPVALAQAIIDHLGVSFTVK